MKFAAFLSTSGVFEQIAAAYNASARRSCRSTSSGALAAASSNGASSCPQTARAASLCPCVPAGRIIACETSRAIPRRPGFCIGKIRGKWSPEDQGPAVGGFRLGRPIHLRHQTAEVGVAKWPGTGRIAASSGCWAT